MIIKQCLGCKEKKPLSEFHRQKHGRLGRTARCKSCTHIRQSMKTRNCQDCGKLIGSKAIRCRSCESKRRWADGLNDGLAGRMKKLWATGHFDDNSEKMKARWAAGDFDYLLTENHLHKMLEGRLAWLAREGFSDETRQKMSKSHRIAWANGTYDHVKAYRKTPEYRLKMSKIKKAAWANGDYDNRKPRGSNQEESR